MSIIRFEEITLEFGDQKILTEADLAIESGERICLIVNELLLIVKCLSLTKCKNTNNDYIRFPGYVL